ncbi:hypothetical protein IJN73_02100 [Candidatus Saccharibacteria bacterium]|nr:hypothetical protein [Candidatus Saccharibacteria bacterium]
MDPNNNDLQRAIDEISGGANSAPVEENNININLGEPPAPKTDDFGMPPMNGAEVTPPEPAMDDLTRMTGGEPPRPEEPVSAPETTPTGDLANVRNTVLKELVPIIDKASLSPDRQFGIIATVIDSTMDKSFIPKALEAARAIPDEKTRAEALLKIVSLIDK